MDAVAKTAYYCCGVRAEDAASVRPICGDMLAQRFMTEEGKEAFRAFAGMKRPNASNATRARIIDDILRSNLQQNPKQEIFLLGAGFDTRAFRLGGGRWFEFEQPALLERKNRLLPVSEANVPIQRIAVEFGRDSLAEKFKPWAGTKNVVVVLEGVTEYLTQAQQTETFKVVHSTFPNCTFICDLMNARFADKTTAPFRVELRKLGTDFVAQRDEPWRTVEEAGFELVNRTSILGRARELGAMSIPGLLFHTVLRGLRDGYGVFEFRARSLA